MDKIILTEHDWNLPFLAQQPLLLHYGVAGDDWFGRTVSGTGQDVLAGGLFADGSLFDDGPPPSLPASERVPESHYENGGDCNGPPSSGPSRDSTPATPLENPAVSFRPIRGAHYNYWPIDDGDGFCH